MENSLQQTVKVQRKTSGTFRKVGISFRVELLQTLGYAVKAKPA